MELDAGAVERSDSGGGERYAPAEFDAPKSVSPDQVAKLKQLEQAARCTRRGLPCVTGI